MPRKDQSLWETYPRCFDVPALLILSIGALIAGLILPVITLEELIFWKHTFSVLTGISSLFDEGHFVLGIIIFLFSVIFPVVKLTVLSCLWFLRVPQERRDAFLHAMGALGKWSMLDVFVVAVMIVITKISGFAAARPEIGIYLFGTSVLLAMAVTMRVERLNAQAG